MSRAREPVRIVPKGWGREVWIANNDLYCGKILEIRKGKRCSLHYHKIKNGDVVEEFEMGPGECMDVPTGLIHQMVALEDCELFEFSTQHFDSDSHRLVKGD
jgi:hypothetical protein